MLVMKQEVVTDNTKSAHILVSGQIHAKPDLTLVKGTTAQKVTQIMDNIGTILVAADATLDDIVKVVIYVTDMSILPELNETYPTFFKKPLPVREAVCVKALPLGAEIEISVIAEQPK
jgi:2-iminobutanoate/2-iminopropanoate deaminase